MCYVLYATFVGHAIEHDRIGVAQRLGFLLLDL
jgi:hypothetical protein